MKGYRTKRIDLPGGKSIEIVYFAEDGEGTGDAPAGDAFTASAPDHPDAFGAQAALEAEEELGGLLLGDDPAVDLHVCPACDSDLVYPVHWEERESDAWHIERRCPNCEWRHSGEYGQDEVEIFDDALNDGTEDLLISLRTFSRANMEADVERLIEAIHSDRIEPMDF